MRRKYDFTTVHFNENKRDSENFTNQFLCCLNRGVKLNCEGTPIVSNCKVQEF